MKKGSIILEDYKIPVLKKGEIFCRVCNQVIKKYNLNRHDNSVKHNNAVLSYVEKVLKN